MNMPISMSVRPATKAVRWIGGMLCLIISLWSMSTHAAVTCSLQAGQPPVNVNVFLQGSITVGRDVPIGTEVYRASYHGPTVSNVSCPAASPTNPYSSTRAYLSNPFPASSYVHPSWGRVYQTNVPGIGVVIWSGNLGPLPATGTFTSNVLIAARWFDISFIKIGNVSPGVITAGAVPSFQMRVGDNNLVVETGTATGSLNIVSRTCTTPDVNVDLGTHSLTELHGIGTTTNAVSVPIALTNCPAFWGRYVNVVNNIPNPTTTSTTPNTLTATVTPSTSIADSTNAVMALQSPGATGIGIQLLQSNQTTPQQFNQQIAIGGLNQTDGSTYRLQLYARYYQTAANTAAGQANGVATVTLSYL